MNLSTAIKIYADADNISLAVRRVFNKKTGKGKGYNAIETDLRNTITSAVERHVGRLSLDQQSEVDSYISERLDFMKSAFAKLNDPMKDRSDERAELIGDNEHESASWFGNTKGREWSGSPVLKAWVAGDDSCAECAANEDQGPIPVDEDFQSGDYAPTAHPNCDCELEYVDEED